jgi:hypothetical protein
MTLPNLLDGLDDGEGLAGAGRAEDDVRDTRKPTLENTRHLERSRSFDKPKRRCPLPVNHAEYF